MFTVKLGCFVDWFFCCVGIVRKQSIKKLTVGCNNARYCYAWMPLIPWQSVNIIVTDISHLSNYHYILLLCSTYKWRLFLLILTTWYLLVLVCNCKFTLLSFICLYFLYMYLSAFTRINFCINKEINKTRFRTTMHWSTANRYNFTTNLWEQNRQVTCCPNCCCCWCCSGFCRISWFLMMAFFTSSTISCTIRPDSELPRDTRTSCTWLLRSVLVSTTKHRESDYALSQRHRLKLTLKVNLYSVWSRSHKIIANKPLSQSVEPIGCRLGPHPRAQTCS